MEPEGEIEWDVIRTDEDEDCPENIEFKWQLCRAVYDVGKNSCLILLSAEM